MSFWRREPIPPRNARLICEDGTIIPLEFTYAGRRGKIHQWVSARPIVLRRAGWNLEVELMPPKSELLVGIDVID